jgi:putative acetyltransferase
MIRTIVKQDNKSLATIIRESLIEYNANKPGTVFFDDSTDHMYEYFQNINNARYFVAEESNTVIGGAGIYPSAGLPVDTCELVRMYLCKDARGIGLGMILLTHCIEAAKELGFKYLYLETMPELKDALRFYEKNGFRYLEKPMGNTGHIGCGLWMIKDI